MSKVKLKLLVSVVAMFITVTGFAQFAQSDNFSIIVNNPTVLDVRANDGYGVNMYMTIPYQNEEGIAFFPPQHGSIVFLNNYTILYSPDSGFVGHDEFVYGISFADKLYYAIDTARVYIDVIAQDSALCQASFTFNINPLNNQVSFHGSNLFPIPGNPTTYLWTFSDNTTSTAMNPIHYFQSGIGEACLTVQTAFGCSNSYCDSVIIAGNNCEANFSYQQGTCINCYYFYDNSDGNVESWHWNFGDNTESSLQNPNHVFPDSGIYHVCLTINTDQNCQETYCENVYVPYHHVIPAVCNASFSFLHSPQADCINCFNFSDFSFGNVISWYWQFGDGTSSTLQNPSHTFVSQGHYDVCLKIITSDSCSSLYCSMVDAVEQSSCVANFTFLAAINNAVNFSDNSTGEVVTWHWDFGDGTTSNMPNPHHVYNASGHFQVCLTIVTASGCTSSFCKDVQTVSHSGVSTYFGGNVYAGNQLLPSGIVILYDVEDNYKAVAYGEIQDGAWAFYTNTERKFLVYAVPKYNYNLSFNKMYLPSYFTDGISSSLYWQTADTVSTYQNSLTYDIYLQVAENLLPFYGEGSIQGGITYTCDSTYENEIYDADWFGCDSLYSTSHLLSNNAQNMPVIILNENNMPVKFQLSGSDGLFNFSNIADNVYKIHTEKAGLITHPYGLVLNTQNPNVSGISIVIGSTEISSTIKDFSADGNISDMKLYPVPVSNILHIKVNANEKEQLHVLVSDVLGKSIFMSQYYVENGVNYFEINTENMNQGVYLITFVNEKGNAFVTKFTK